MKNMFKFILIASALMCAASFADNSQEPSTKAGPCVHLRHPYQCANYFTGECFWDEADQRCENRNNWEDACSRIQNPYRCVQSYYNCFWDEDDQRCERRY